MIFQRHGFIWAASTLAMLAACGGGGELVVPGAGGAGGAGASGGASTVTGGSGGTIFPGGCESNLVCGQGECCESGDECVLGSCLAACPSEVRCGDDLSVCCASGEVCLADSCVSPTGPCQDWADCEEGEFCEPTLGQCLPQPGEDLCEYIPAVGTLTPSVEWSWTTTTIEPAHVQVINMPVVADLEGDGTPDVVIVTSNTFSNTGFGYLRALDGATGAEKWSAQTDVYQSAYRVQPRGTPAVADIDGDGSPEIVTLKAGGGLIAFEHDGTYKWSSTATDGVTPWVPNLASATVAIADLEGDGTPEIIVGGVVLEANGQVRFDNGVFAGSNDGNYGAVSIVADLDGMGDQEVVTGRRAFRSDGTQYWDNGLTDGYPAIADLDLDGTPELVVVAGGTVRVQDPTTGAVLASITMPGAGAGGPPTIANFDADPEPEIASANGSAYAVFGYVSTPTPALSVQWSVPTQDLSSNRTGSSVFDFEGDGVAEVVYGDECYFRIYSGLDGTVLFEVESSSGTIHEYPVVVDVDGDNNTEVVVVANNLNHNDTTCPYPASQTKVGVHVYGDANDGWVRTRKLWNQHAYHIVNIGSSLQVPAPEPPSWIVPPGFNNYRQSNQGAGVFNAPDLQVSLSALLHECPNQIVLEATVQNLGSLGVAAGIPVTFYQGASVNGPVIATVYTTKALLPGQFEVVSATAPVTGPDMAFAVRVDADGSGMGTENECLEDNNDAAVQGVTCPSLN